MSAVKPTMSRLPDAFALGVSGLCLGHCLALPALGAILPFIGALAHPEWIHVLFLVLAAPASLVALVVPGGWRRPWVRITCALGLAGLVAGLPWGASEMAEITFTSLGSAFLLCAHVLNLRSRSHAVPFVGPESSRAVN